MPPRRRRRNPAEAFEEYRWAYAGDRDLGPSGHLEWWFPETGRLVILGHHPHDGNVMELRLGSGAQEPGRDPRMRHADAHIEFPSVWHGEDVELTDAQLRTIGMEGYLLLPDMIDRIHQLYPTARQMRWDGVRRLR